MPLSITEARQLGDKELEFQTEAHKKASLIGRISANDSLMPIDRIIAQRLGMLGKQKSIKERLGKMKYGTDTNYYAVKSNILHPQEPKGLQTTDLQYYEPLILELLLANPGKGYKSNEIARLVRYLKCLSDKADKKEFSNIMKSVAKKNKAVKVMKFENDLYYYIR